ncbi:MAG: leucyl/phenylalanyl-tRNA--protein transferase [Oceanicoccus sp.]
MSSPLIPWLDSADYSFPATQSALADPNGLLAVGGDLSVERLLAAYRQGIFPWYEEPQPILWWSPSPRAVLYPDNIYISKSLAKRLKRQQYSVTADQAFSQVMQHCGTVPRFDQDGTWINDQMLMAYQRLHELGKAHSLEVWQNGQLVGGLYGIALGNIFFGESMFSLATDASKVALVFLSIQLKQWGFVAIDCQVSNPHLSSMGAQEIDRVEFDSLLKHNVDYPQLRSWAGNWPYSIIEGNGK